MDDSKIKYKWNLIISARIGWSEEKRKEMNEIRTETSIIANQNNIPFEPMYKKRMDLFNKKNKHDCLYLSIRNGIWDNQSSTISITNGDEIKLLEKVGEREYLKQKNEGKWNDLLIVVKDLEQQKLKCEFNSARFKVIDQHIQDLQEWDGIYYDWFFKNGFDIPQIDHFEVKKPETEISDEATHHQLEAAQQVALQLRKKLKYKDLTKEKLIEIIDRTRKKNGKHNYSKIAEELGLKSHETAKKYVKDFELYNY